LSHFIFNSVQKAEESILQNGTYIVVLQAIRVPPHLLIAVNGKTWSISVSGQLPAEPIEKLFSYIHRKQIPTIFTELRLPSGVSADAFVAMLNDAVSRYPEVCMRTWLLVFIRFVMWLLKYSAKLLPRQDLFSN
jgi:hypothetical protein